MGKSFRYLGRYFDFNMSEEEHQSELYDLFTDIMNKIDELPLHPKNKILLYNRHLHAFKDLLALHCFWYIQNLDLRKPRRYCI